MKSFLYNTLLPRLKTAQPWAASGFLLTSRAIVGFAFFQAGLGKLKNLEQTTGFFESLGIPAPGLHAAFIGGLEMIGGLMLLAGILSRLISAPLAATMIVALLTAHLEEIADMGSLLSAAPTPYLLVTLTIILFGPGKFAIDQLLCKKCRCSASCSA